MLEDDDDEEDDAAAADIEEAAMAAEAAAAAPSATAAEALSGSIACVFDAQVSAAQQRHCTRWMRHRGLRRSNSSPTATVSSYVGVLVANAQSLLQIHLTIAGSILLAIASRGAMTASQATGRQRSAGKDK
jgi:hypothetical protein